jgi:hypothetical protein
MHVSRIKNYNNLCRINSALAIREFRLFPFLKDHVTIKIFRFLPKSKFSLNNIFIDFPTGKTNLKTQISSFLTENDKLCSRPAYKKKISFNYLNYKD